MAGGLMLARSNLCFMLRSSWRKPGRTKSQGEGLRSGIPEYRNKASRRTNRFSRNVTGGQGLRVLITGGAGFIGSNFIRHLLHSRRDVEIINFDSLTYAGNPESLADIVDNPRYKFVRGDITAIQA